MRGPVRGRSTVLGLLAMGLVPLLGLTLVVASPAHAQSLSYRQLDGDGLVFVLPAPTEFPSWLGFKATQPAARSFAPEAGFPVCYLPDDRVIRGGKADLGAYSSVNFGAFPSGGYANTLSRIYQFPTVAAADAAWSQLTTQARNCVGTQEFPYQFPDEGRIGDIISTTSVRPGDTQFGSRALVLNIRSSWKRTGAAQADRTGGQVSIWRHVGNVLVETMMTKVVTGDVRSSLSNSDLATMQALSLLTGERYVSAAGMP